MSLATLVARIAAGETPAEIMANPDKGEPATAATARNGAPVAAKPAPVLACTAETSATAQNDKLQAWEVWQAAHPSPGTVPLNKAERAHLLAWLELIGETDKATIADVLATCERYPDTRAHCLREARNAGARRIIAARVALEAAEERAAIMEHDGHLKRTEAERIAKLAEAFYNHLWGPGMATGCCYGRTGRYCHEGRKLKDAYYEAAKSAGKLA